MHNETPKTVNRTDEAVYLKVTFRMKRFSNGIVLPTNVGKYVGCLNKKSAIPSTGKANARKKLMFQFRLNLAI